MKKHSQVAIASTNSGDTDAIRAAQSVRRDFTNLIAMFDRQLTSLPESDKLARAHVARARAAAERGLQLSRILIDSLSR